MEAAMCVVVLALPHLTPLLPKPRNVLKYDFRLLCKDSIMWCAFHFMLKIKVRFYLELPWVKLCWHKHLKWNYLAKYRLNWYQNLCRALLLHNHSCCIVCMLNILQNIHWVCMHLTKIKDFMQLPTFIPERFHLLQTHHNPNWNKWRTAVGKGLGTRHWSEMNKGIHVIIPCMYVLSWGVRWGSANTATHIVAHTCWCKACVIV